MKAGAELQLRAKLIEAQQAELARREVRREMVAQVGGGGWSECRAGLSVSVRLTMHRKDADAYMERLAAVGTESSTSSADRMCLPFPACYML